MIDLTDSERSHLIAFMAGVLAGIVITALLIVL